jgi:hypothetical protein
MAKLRQLALLLLYGTAFYLGMADSAFGTQNYCSLQVQVQTPTGQLPEALVEVREENGRKIEKEQRPGHEVQFCDLGILPVTVTVGLKDCEVVVKNVYLRWGQTYTLKVIYDQERCSDEKAPPPKPLCQVVLRVKAQNKAWIGGAVAKFDDTSRPPAVTDQAGRAMFYLGLNERVQGNITARGFNAKEFSLGCFEARGQEEVLTLSR